MGFFESLFYTIWRGIAIGILISAPMGPVGILCIQRTLDKGRKTGLYTGIGAAISDLFYCILTGFGLSFIENFLERNQNIIQLAGSVLLIAFAVYLFKKNPASSLKTPEEEASQISPHKNILGGFLFTFSNPLILFLIIGLFARFNFSIPEINFYYYIAGYAAIFFGAVIWWEFVTFTVNKLRAHFNLRSMWLINRIIGVIILLFALVGIITGITNLATAHTLHWNQGRGYQPFVYETKEGILIENPTDSTRYDSFKLGLSSRDVILSFRAKNINGQPARKYQYITQGKKEIDISNPSWGFFILLDRDTIIFEVKGGEKVSAIESLPCLYLDVKGKQFEKNESLVLTNNINPYNGDNLWKISVAQGEMIVETGDHNLNRVFERHLRGDVTGFGFYAGSGGKILISDIDIDYKTEGDNINPVSLDGLRQYLDQSKDPLEGYWAIYDRELEENLIKLGGDYIMACIQDGSNYKFIYLEGAATNRDEWTPGDVKITLYPTSFPGIFNVEWIDAMKDRISNEIKAQQGEGQSLLIQFPYHSSKIRLRKLPSSASSATSCVTSTKSSTKSSAKSTAATTAA